jgi:hypothetical protein
MTEANNRQVDGTHYKQMGIEHWDVVVLDNLDYFQGQITKYVMRWRGKNGITDLEKAKHFLDKYIEVETLRAQGKLTLAILMAAIRKIEEAIEKDKQADHRAALADAVNGHVRASAGHCPSCGWALPCHAGNCAAQR